MTATATQAAVIGSPAGPDALLDGLKRLQLTRTCEILSGLLSEASRGKWSHQRLLEQLVSRELEARQDKRVRLNLQAARFPFERTLEQFDFAAQPGLDETRVRQLAEGWFINENENILLIGAPGVGKTHLAVALGRKIVEQGHAALFVTATGLLAMLAKAEAAGRLEEKLSAYAKPQLLIVDELGYLPFEQRTAHLFFQVVSRRYEKGSIIITTNQRVGDWDQIFGNEGLARVILDRFLHHSHAFMITGESYRLREKRRTELFRAGAEQPRGETGTESSGPASGK